MFCCVYDVGMLLIGFYVMDVLLLLMFVLIVEMVFEIEIVGELCVVCLYWLVVFVIGLMLGIGVVVVWCFVVDGYVVILYLCCLVEIGCVMVCEFGVVYV